MIKKGINRMTDLVTMQSVLKKMTQAWKKVTDNDFPSAADFLAHQDIKEFKKHIVNTINKNTDKGRDLALQGLCSLECFVLMYSDDFSKDTCEKAIKNLKKP
jgi:hypothetical protein